MIRPESTDPELASRLAKLPEDGLSVFTLMDGAVRGFLFQGSRLVTGMRAAHGLGILETVALGQAYLAAGLLSATLKGEDRLALRIDCQGPLEGLAVEADALGAVRGRLFAQAIPLEAPPESLDLAPFIGKGTLSVSRYTAANPQPFTGQVELASSRIAEDLAEYYLRSEQTKTAFALSVNFDREGQVDGAGGLLLQALPGADEAGDLASLETIFSFLPGLGEYFSGGGTRGDFLKSYFGLFGPEALGEREVAFECPCSAERYLIMVASLPEARGFLAEGPWPMEVVCHNCGSAYSFSREEFERKLDRKDRLKGR